MAQQFTEISNKLKKFIEQQKIFFVATATSDGHVNLSPKGMDSLRVVNKNTIVWLNVTGSGNETSTHVQEMPRMTIMFTSFEGDPLILRLYGNATVIHRNDSQWDKMITLFKPTPGARQLFQLSVEIVQTSCGMSTPFFDYVSERDQLKEWAIKKGDVGLKEFWHDKNQVSLDGKATNIMAKNT